MTIFQLIFCPDPAARSEAHRWRCHAEAKMKEADSVRDQQQVNLESLEELGSVRQELRETQRKLEESHQQLENVRSNSLKDSGMTDLVNVLRGELEEKDKQIEAYSKSLHNLKVVLHRIEDVLVCVKTELIMFIGKLHRILERIQKRVLWKRKFKRKILKFLFSRSKLTNFIKLWDF